MVNIKKQKVLHQLRFRDNRRWNSRFWKRLKYLCVRVCVEPAIPLKASRPQLCLISPGLSEPPLPRPHQAQPSCPPPPPNPYMVKTSRVPGSRKRAAQPLWPRPPAAQTTTAASMCVWACVLLYCVIKEYHLSSVMLIGCLSVHAQAGGFKQ